MSESEEYLTVEQIAARLGWTPKTVQNKMGPRGIFKKGVHFAEAPGMPVLFKWSAVVELYKWESGTAVSTEQSIPMARGYEMK